jgi:hypothetical protein
MPLDLLVPHLLLAPDAPVDLRSLRLPALERWMARGDAGFHPAKSAAAWLAAEFGVPTPVPYAAVSLAADLPDSEGEWLRADPVHLRIEGDALLLQDAALAAPTMAESEVLAKALQDFFRDDGLEFRVVAPDRWYVRVPSGESPLTTPLPEALGRNVFGLLPTGRGRINWRSAITEAQMVLAGHEVNAARERTRKPAINSVWFWGEGSRPAALGRRKGIVFADDAFARGLGAIGGAQVHGAPRHARDLAAAPPGESTLAFIETVARAASSGDEEGWRRAATALDADFFAAIPGLIERHGSVRIVLPGAPGTRISILTRAARWRLLRRARPLSAHA